MPLISVSDYSFRYAGTKAFSLSRLLWKNALRCSPKTPGMFKRFAPIPISKQLMMPSAERGLLHRD